MSDRGETRPGGKPPQSSKAEPQSGGEKPASLKAVRAGQVEAPDAPDRSDLSKQQLDEQQVVSFLRQHPDFLARHPALLMSLEIPHTDTAGASSLLEYQAEVLRDKNRELNGKLKQLVAIAGENQQLMERVHRLVLRLMACESKQQLLDELRQRLQRDFGAQWLSVCLFNDDPGTSPVEGLAEVPRNDARLAPFSDFLTDLEPLCGRLRADKLAFLFADQAEQIQSSVLLPLDAEGRVGMMAIGSEDGNRFYPGMGTEFLRLIGEVMGRHLDRTPNAGERLRA